MSSPETLLTELAGEVAESALSRHGVKPHLAKALRVYRQVSVAKAGAEFCVHLVLGNYTSALLIVATEIGKEVSAKYLAEAGGLFAQISRNDGGFALAGDLLTPRQPLPILHIVSLANMSLAEQEEQGNEVLRACAKYARLARSADGTARVAAARHSKLIADTDGTLDHIQFLFPATSKIVAKIRPKERLGVRSYHHGAKYSGSFIDDKRDGFGVLSIPALGTYAGTWRNDRPFGFGVWKIRDRGIFAGEVPHGSASTVVGLSQAPDGAIFLGEHYPPFLEGVERGEIAPKEFCPYGFGARTLDRSLQRGLWEGSKLTTELTTRLDIREKVLNDVSAAKSPELILWTAQQRYEIAVERLKEAIAQSDISTTLTDFTAAS